MSFKDRPIQQRWKRMGDEAEGVFERVYGTVAPKQKFVRYGLDRAPINTSRVPAFVRYTPDYLTAKGLVEVQGFGVDQTFKLKVDKFEALQEWAQTFRVDLFVYDSMHDAYAWIRLADLVDVWETREDIGEIREFPEGKPYWAIPKGDLPTVDGWHEAPDAAAA